VSGGGVADGNELEGDDGEEGSAAYSRLSRSGADSRRPVVDDGTRIRLLPMHSLISFEDQMAAFESAALDPRTKVIIATNMAESSITIPGVTACIDFGRHKQAEFVPRAGCTMLRATWVSQASAAQRAGRAGRVQPGVVYRLYSRAVFSSVMPP
jgi:HrpA-like RNA helicase